MTEKLEEIFKSYKVQDVVNFRLKLAAIQLKIILYVKSNIVGFANILENCRQYKIEHLVYASTSSVYGATLRCHFRT